MIRHQKAADLTTPQKRQQGVAAVWHGFFETYKGPAAVIIQAAWRGYVARKLLKAQRTGRLLKGADPRRRVARDCAARVIQRWWRGWLARRDTREAVRAITRIQAAWRGRAARASYPALRRQWRRRNEAATELQRYIRGYLARIRTGKLPPRSRVMAQRLQALAAPGKAAYTVRDHAATTIQRHYRGWKGHKRAVWVRAERERLQQYLQRTRAATTIQAAWRGWLVRRQQLHAPHPARAAAGHPLGLQAGRPSRSLKPLLVAPPAGSGSAVTSPLRAGLLGLLQGPHSPGTTSPASLSQRLSAGSLPGPLSPLSPAAAPTSPPAGVARPPASPGTAVTRPLPPPVPPPLHLPAYRRSSSLTSTSPSGPLPAHPPASAPSPLPRARVRAGSGPLAKTLSSGSSPTPTPNPSSAAGAGGQRKGGSVVPAPITAPAGGASKPAPAAAAPGVTPLSSAAPTGARTGASAGHAGTTSTLKPAPLNLPHFSRSPSLDRQQQGQGPTLARSTSSNDGSRGAAGAGAGAKPKWAAISPQASTGFSLRRSTSSSSSSAANAGGAQPRVPPALRGQVPAFNVIHHQVMSKAGDRPGPPAANPTATVATDAAGAVS